MNQLTQQANSLKQAIFNYHKDNLPIVYKHWVDLYELIIYDEVTRDTLSDVLDKYQEYLTGNLSNKDAVEYGLNYARSVKKSNPPK